MITGCAHPGLSDLLNAASSLGNINGAIGGFHDFSKLETLEELELVSPCHCTRRKEKIERKYPGKYVKCGVGLVIDYEKNNA